VGDEPGGPVEPFVEGLVVAPESSCGQLRHPLSSPAVAPFPMIVCAGVPYSVIPCSRHPVPGAEGRSGVGANIDRILVWHAEGRQLTNQQLSAALSLEDRIIRKGR
jgi:hypothetical protein